MSSSEFRIDVQHHILPPRYVAEIGEAAIGQLIVSGRMPEWAPQISIDAMDRNGIDLAVTSISAPAFPEHASEKARILARECNEYAAAMGENHPGRFGFFANLPMPDVADSLKELEYSLDELGADGVCLMTSYGGRYPGHPNFAELFQELDRRGTVVHLHPVGTDGPVCIPGIPAATLDFPFDTTRAAASLLFSGTLSRCRRLSIILAHAGGTVPFLSERMARLERRPEFKAAVPDGARADLQRFYFDTALSANESIFASLRTLVGMDRVLFASDYPFAPEDTMTATVEGMGKLGLSAEESEMINSGNVLKIMPTLRKRIRAGGAQIAISSR